ncbi:sulfurtransferase complex subunit TusD [Thaumasiovibrio sp. DFM-14]|uniref:sulfurtransferase complex subunit TusD n=1 Tax=Thaumasiovibrio sp. DFM-14 TaxID=3384792 RepID=UPI0039A33967
MSLKYALVVNGPAYGTQAARSALLFAQTLIDQGHTLARVFFYQEGVHNANRLVIPANDEFQLLEAWQTLANTHQVELQTCIAAALRRGVVGQQEAEQAGLDTENLAAGIEQAGLGSLAEALLTMDRVIQF